jgi:hypothetical protein
MENDLKPLWSDASGDAWAPYNPSKDGAWDLGHVAHLHRRAGFGATRSRLTRDVEDGPEAAIGRIFKGDPVGPDGRTTSELNELYAVMAESARRDPSIGRLRSAWLFRLMTSSHPLRERMIVAWHSHYATGASKVSNPSAMQDQLETIL